MPPILQVETNFSFCCACSSIIRKNVLTKNLDVRESEILCAVGGVVLKCIPFPEERILLADGDEVSTLAVAASGVKECDAPLMMFGAVPTHVEVLEVLMTLVVLWWLLSLKLWGFTRFCFV